MNETEKFILDRLNRIEDKLDTISRNLDDKIESLSGKIDVRISPIEKFQYKMLGMAVLASSLISLVPAVIAYAKS